MGNNPSSATEDPEGAEGSSIPKSMLTKIQCMGHRLRVEERAELYRALAELREDRRRLSLDLLEEKRIREAGLTSKDMTSRVRDTDKPSWAAYENDPNCSLCGKPARRQEAYPCRVCTRIYHPICLGKCGECRDVDLQAAENALSNTGWSCYICSNLSLLLTELEINQLIDEFDMFDKNKDEHISWDEIMKHTHPALPAGRRREQLPSDERLEMRLSFKMADQDNDDSLDWWEFLNYQAKTLLAKRSKEELVSLLSEKEVIKCKTLFRSMDTDEDGVVTLLEARQAVRDWCQKYEHNMPPEEFSKLLPGLDLHSEIRAQMFVDGEDAHRESVRWPEFLADQSLYIISTRPNVSARHIESVLKDACHAD
ncbi:PHD finger protein 24 [Aplysia californica]|uniref:PHD finger protein 24 n=1 Tax=Aplysia californica TaxID=6500 RepID=A0ABM1W0C4_APLCA|nr:PHD finger protein 24 [Aplysia californica]